MTTTEFELLEGDTREPPHRNTWHMCPHPIGDLWIKRRANDDGYELLSADAVVVVTQEFLHRLTRLDPELVDQWSAGLDTGSYLTFYGHDRQVRYRVLKREASENRWLLKREDALPA